MFLSVEIQCCLLQHITLWCIVYWNIMAVCQSILLSAGSMCGSTMLCKEAQCCVQKHRPQADAWEPPGRSTNHLIAQDTNLLAEIMNKFV